MPADDFGAEALRLRAHLGHQIRAHDAVAISRPVLDQRREHQLSAGLEPLDEERLQVRARGVQRGREPGRARADDDDVAGHWNLGGWPTRSDVLVDQLLERALSARPTTCSTIWPLLNSSSVGIPRMLKRMGVAGFSSTFILPTTTRPS